MSENKINEIIGEIIHMACQAELVEDEQIKRQALGDIYDAIASVLPVEHARTARGAVPTDGRACRPATAEDGKEVVYRTPQPVVDFCQSEMQRLEAFKARKIHWQTFATKVDIADIGRTRQNGKVYEIRIQKRRDPKAANEFFCCVNGTTVIDGTFSGNAWMAKKALERAMQAMVNEKARKRRLMRLADKRRAGILTPEEELADTIARQKEEE